MSTWQILLRLSLDDQRDKLAVANDLNALLKTAVRQYVRSLDDGDPMGSVTDVQLVNAVKEG